MNLDSRRMPVPFVAARFVTLVRASVCLALALLVLFAAPSMAAGTYYVDNQNPAASDVNPGTLTLPYRTIGGAAAARNGPGTTILVKPGNYPEMVTVPASGSSTSPFVFQATGPGVVVDGADNLSAASDWALVSGTVYRAASVNWEPLQVYVDDVRMTPSTAAPTALPVNSFVYVSGGNGGLFVNLGGASPGTRVTRVGRRTYGFKLSGRSYVTIQGFAVTRTQDRGIYLYSNSANCVVRGNTVTNTYKTGISVNAVTNVLIEQNRCSFNQDHGIGLTAASTGCTVQDNESFQNAHPTARQANGIYLNRSTGNLIRRNRVHHNQDSGLQYSSSSDANIAIQNVTWSNGDHGLDCLNSANSVTIGCVSYGNYKDGFSIEGTSPGGSLYDCIAINNGVNVAPADGSLRYNLWVDANSSVGFQSDYNLFWNSTSPPPVKWVSTAYPTLGAFSAATGRDAHSTQADPRFKNAANGDFELLAGSPAIDAATSLVPNWPSDDVLGRARVDDPLTPNSGAGSVAFADRGAYEFQASGSLPVAALQMSPSSGPAPLAVTADASASSSPNGAIVSYAFDFGDSTTAGPQASPFASHTYAGGTWQASVTVTDASGYTRTATASVNALFQNQPPNGVMDTPVANLTIAQGQAVNFTGSGGDPDGNTPIAYRWDFGGAAPISTLEDPGPILFNTIGTYAITFTVTDALGSADPTPDTRTIIVTAPPVGTVPDEIHWTFTGPTSVTFDWRGFDKTFRYGLTPSYGSTVTAQTPSPLPWSSAGPFWEAKLTGLQPGTTYHYSIGSSPDQTFRTAPVRGSSGFSIFAQADVGDATAYPRVGTLQGMIAATNPAFVLMVGDLTYGNVNGQTAVDRHFNDMMPWSRTSAYMVAWGNHENEAGDDLRNYKGRFDLPNPQTSPGVPVAGGEDWSWFDYGNVRFIAYPEPYAGALAAWRPAAAALMDAAQADPAITFIVTFGHRPAYSSGHHSGESDLKAHLDALGDTHSKYVLNINGHSHDYERTLPQHGVTHITAGTGGSTLEAEVGPCPWAGGCPPPAFTAFRAMHHVAFQLTFTATTIQGQALCGPSAPENDVTCTQGSVLDSFMIGDLPPVVTAPASAAVAEEQTLTINVSAADPNGDAISSLAATNLPPGATFTPGPGNLTGVLSWTPANNQSGTHTVTFTATNALSASTSTVITVNNVDRAPVVVAPAAAGGPKQVPMTFSVTASDADGEAITSLTATGLPTGATFTPGPGNTSGSFAWTPGATQSGSYVVTFTAANSLSGSASTAITVSSVDRAPVVSAPATANATSGSLLTVQVTAGDPDGDAITSLTASGLPAGASFSAGAAKTSGTLSWTPSAAQVGSHAVTFTASNALSGSATTTIVVNGADLAPVVSAPATASAKAGTSLTVNVTASDPNGDAIGSLTASARPGAVFTTGGSNTSGSFTWTPGVGDVGDHAIAFTAANALSGSDTTLITVLPPNQVPVAALTVSPANGNAPLIVAANATGSVDNDGSIVSYRFDFGDGVVTAPQASPLAPSHTYATGTWNLAVQVTDNEGGVGTKVVQVIAAAIPASPNLVGNPSFEVGTTGWGVYSAGTIARVAGGFDGGWALQMTGGTTTSSFGANDSPNWVTSVPAPGTTYRFSAWVRSATHTGIAKLQVREYAGTTKVGALYSNGVTLSPNWQLVTVDYLTVAGGSSLDFQVLDAPAVPSEVFLTDNISIRNVTAVQPASAGRGGDPALVGGVDPELGVHPSGMTLRGILAPSPIRSRSTLSFATSRPGPLTVEVFEITGRRVRVLLDEPFAPAGLHQVAVDLRDGRGAALPAGMYFYMVRAAEGRSTGRFVFTP